MLPAWPLPLGTIQPLSLSTCLCSPLLWTLSSCFPVSQGFRVTLLSWDYLQPLSGSQDCVPTQLPEGRTGWAVLGCHTVTTHSDLDSSHRQTTGHCRWGPTCSARQRGPSSKHWKPLLLWEDAMHRACPGVKRREIRHTENLVNITTIIANS